MNKKVYQLMSVIVLLALTFGSYSNASASSESAPQLAGTTYYVATTGNDANAGTSAAPFKTIQKCANAAPSGGVCSVAAGTYAERFNIDKAISVVCATPKSCIIKGAVLAGNAVLDGFYSLNSDTNDGALVANGSGNTIKNNKVEGSCMVGIKLNGSNNLAENNEILKSRQCAGSYGADADGIRYFGANQVMRGNYIHDIFFDSVVNTTPHIDCFQTWGGASGAIIENNICDNFSANIGSSESTQGANIENDTGAIFRHNYFRTYGKKIMIESSSTGTKIDNNIFVGGAIIAGAPSQYGFFGSGSNETAANNIFYNINIANGTSVLYGVSSVSGNLLNTDPKMNGFCSSAYPSVGIPCGGVTSPTSTPLKTATATPLSSPTIAPTITQSVTSTSVVVPSATPIASSIPALPTSTALVQPSTTPVASLVPASPTVAPVQPSVTPTASSLPAQPTSTSVPPSATPVAATPTASAAPVLPTSTAVPPTAQAQSQPASEKTYDDKNASFVYSADWRSVSLAQASGGSFRKTGEDGSTVTFTFTGQSFSLLYTAGPAFGQVKVYIDGALVQTIDQHERSSIYQRRWNYPKQLTLGKHTIKLVTVGNGGAKSSIDAVIVR